MVEISKNMSEMQDVSRAFPSLSVSVTKVSEKIRTIQTGQLIAQILQKSHQITVLIIEKGKAEWAGGSYTKQGHKTRERAED